MPQSHGWGRRGQAPRSSRTDTSTDTSSAPLVSRSPSAQKDVDRLHQALDAHPAVSAWTSTQSANRGYQLYLAGTRLESIRTTEQQSLGATIHVHSGETMGTARFELQPGEDPAPPLEEAVAIARQSEIPVYHLPEGTSTPSVRTVGADLEGDPEAALASLQEELISAVTRQPRVRLASAEFHAVLGDAVRTTSTGLVVPMPTTNVTSELVLIGDDGRGGEAEVQDLRRRRRVADLELANLIEHLAEEARDGSVAKPMTDYSGPVVLGAESLDSYFRPVRDQASLQSAYRQTTAWELGQWVGDSEPKGDALTLTGDATLAYGTSTSPCDGDGTPSRATTIVEDGRFVRRWGGQQYAQYLGEEATGSFGNTVIAPGTAGASDIFAGPAVLEVRRFSWLTPSRSTGDYSSEIRFGYLHRDGQRTPVKGGSLLGNVFVSVTDCRMDRRVSFIGNGSVPRRIRFNGLEVAGVERG